MKAKTYEYWLKAVLQNYAFLTDRGYEGKQATRVILAELPAFKPKMERGVYKKVVAALRNLND